MENCTLDLKPPLRKAYSPQRGGSLGGGAYIAYSLGGYAYIWWGFWFLGVDFGKGVSERGGVFRGGKMFLVLGVSEVQIVFGYFFWGSILERGVGYIESL